ncbi:MAG TPA: hypothetical protein ENN84_05335 [Candidatus Marinimicrobia bacterium]|nr:hypothetical protein [Candidatus Neomarinimicrobiota bacterium]
MGQEIFAERLMLSAGERHYRLPARNDMGSGLYFLRFQYAGQT